MCYIIENPTNCGTTMHEFKTSWEKWGSVNQRHMKHYNIYKLLIYMEKFVLLFIGKTSVILADWSSNVKLIAKEETEDLMKKGRSSITLSFICLYTPPHMAPQQPQTLPAIQTMSSPPFQGRVHNSIDKISVPSVEHWNECFPWFSLHFFWCSELSICLHHMEVHLQQCSIQTLSKHTSHSPAITKIWGH